MINEIPGLKESGIFYDMKNTILIVGAGASKALHGEFGLGWELIRDIADRVTDRTQPEAPYLSKLMDSKGLDYATRSHFLKTLEEYRSNVGEEASIDAFMDEIAIFPEFNNVKDRFSEIAKYMIVSHVLGYESRLKESINSSGRQPNWIDEVVDYILAQGILDGHPTATLRIITFNYDRTIEHLIYTHPKLENQKAQVIRYLKENLLHVYGRIGPLEWEDSDDAFEFGEHNNQANKIYTKKNAISLMYTEREAGGDDIGNAKINHWIHGYIPLTIGAFGFNFDLINCRRLGLQKLEHSRQKFIANIYPNPSLVFSQRRHLANRIREIKHDVELRCTSCADFLSYVLK